MDENETKLSKRTSAEQGGICGVCMRILQGQTNTHERCIPIAKKTSFKHKKVSALDCNFLARRPSVSNTAFEERRRSYQHPLSGPI